MAEYLIKGESLTAIADEVRTLSDVNGTMSLGEMTNNLNGINTEVDTQADLIAQIVTVLEGKAAGSSNLTLQDKTVTPTQSNQTITADSGYDGLSEVTVMGDANLVAENIAEGVTIFNITGTHSGGSGSSGSDSVETCTVHVIYNDYISISGCYTTLDGDYLFCSADDGAATGEVLEGGESVMSITLNNVKCGSNILLAENYGMGMNINMFQCDGNVVEVTDNSYLALCLANGDGTINFNA